MRSFRHALAIRIALAVLVLSVFIGLSSVLALRSILYRQLDATLLHLAEVEAQAGAATAGSDFEFHEGVLLASRAGPPAELTRYAQLWTNDGQPLVRSRNLKENLDLPAGALSFAARGEVSWNTHVWRGQRLRCVLYPLRLVARSHGIHVLQVAAPLEPVERTLRQFALLVGLSTLLATIAGYSVGRLLARLALRPTREITEQAEALEAGSLTARITAHAEVDEFSRLVTVLNGMLARLEDAFQVQRRFTADASHELRAPLTALRGEIDIALRKDRTAEEYRTTLKRSHEEVLRLVRLADDLLTLARSDAALPLEHEEALGIKSVLERVISRVAPTAAAAAVGFAVNGADRQVLGDPGILDRVVANLVDNAIKYSPSGGTVHLTIEGEAEVVLTVADEGPGIPQGDIRHLFTRFFRDVAGPRAEGTGLGLAIARAGAEAHDGHLDFIGNGPGAIFRLTLTRIPARPAVPAAAAADG
ncbi:MAG: ATP-binding protein [Gemmatimonadota bacterium]